MHDTNYVGGVFGSVFYTYRYGDITSPTPGLDLVSNYPSDIFYSWNDGDRILGCRECTNYHTTYGEYKTLEQNLRSLIGLWHFNEDNQATIFDISWYGNNEVWKTNHWDGYANFLQVTSFNPVPFSELCYVGTNE